MSKNTLPISLFMVSMLYPHACHGEDLYFNKMEIVKNKNEIAGPDINGNGVRDDLDDYVDSLPDTESQKRALRQGFRTIREAILIDTADKNAVLDVMKKSAASVWCIYSQYDSDAGKKSDDVEKYSINTKARLKAYAAFNAAASGRSSVMPKGDGCE